MSTFYPGAFTFTTAASSSCHNGLVPTPSTAMTGYVLTTGGWKNNAGSVAYSKNAGTANAIADGKTIDCGLVTS